MTQQIQLALQGGGARLAALLAAADAIQELENGDAITITRLAGTSAGAIAAALLAANVNISVLRQFLLDSGNARMAQIFPPVRRTKAMWRLLNSRPLLPTEPLRSYLSELLLKVKIDPLSTIRDIEQRKNVSLLLTAANVHTGSEHSFPPNEPIIEALLTSCGLPYVFRAPGGTETPHIVDGGIFDNLPASKLLDTASEQDYGKVIAVSFREQNYPPQPQNIADFSKAIFNSMIDVKTRRSRELVGRGNLYEIDTALRTFDFDRFISDGLAHDAYERVKGETKNWFESWLTRQDEAHQQDFDFEQKSAPEYLREIEKKVLQMYNVFSPVEKPECMLARMEVTANCLVKKHENRYGIPDEIKVTYEFRSLNTELIRAMNMKFMSASAGMRDGASWSAVNNDGKTINLIVIPIIDESKRRYEAIIVFDPPLSGGASGNTTYTLTSKQTINDFMSPLRDVRGDYLGLKGPGPFRQIRKAEVLLYTPASFGPLRAFNWEDAPGPDEEENWNYLQGQRFNPVRDGAPPGFEVTAWKCEGIGPDEALRIRYVAEDLQAS